MGRNKKDESMVPYKPSEFFNDPDKVSAIENIRSKSDNDKQELENGVKKEVTVLADKVDRLARAFMKSITVDRLRDAQGSGVARNDIAIDPNKGILDVYNMAMTIANACAIIPAKSDGSADIVNPKDDMEILKVALKAGDLAVRCVEIQSRVAVRLKELEDKRTSIALVVEALGELDPEVKEKFIKKMQEKAKDRMIIKGGID